MRRPVGAALLCVCLGAFGCAEPAPSSSGRPSSPPDASASAEGCGAEDLECDPGEPTAAPADCKRRAYEEAISSNIDAGRYPFDVIGCDGRHMALRLDLGTGACPPKASKEQRGRCARVRTAYFAAGEGGWVLLAYESRTSCESVQSVDEAFPTELCRG